jgi:O-antigen ligase
MLLLIALAGFILFSFFLFFIINKYSRESYLLFNAYFLPLMSLGVTPEAFGGLKLFDALSYFAFFFFIKDFNSISNKNRIYFYLFGALMVILFAGSLHSEFVSNSLMSILSVLPIFIFSRLVVKEVSVNPGLINKMIRAFQLSFLIAAVFIGMQMLVGVQFSFYQDLNPNVSGDEGTRYPGFFMDSQTNSQFIGMLSFLFLINFKNILKPSLLNYLLFILVIVSMFYSGGRSGFFGFAAGFAFLLLFFGRKMKYFIGIGALAVLTLMPFLKDSFVLFRRIDTVDDSYIFRTYIWKEAYDIFLHHKLLGIGIGNYKDYINRYSPDQYYVLKDNTILLLDQPENGYLKILTEFGAIGFVASFLLIIIPVAKAIAAHLKTRNNYLALFCIASIICWFVSFDSLYTLTDRRIVILLTSLVCFVIKSNYIAPVREENNSIDIPLRNRLSPL